MSTNNIILCDDKKTPQNYTNQEIYISSTSNTLYFANEIALHKELIGYSYANEFLLRHQNYVKDMEEFTSIGKDLLSGNISTFRHISRYYAHPSKWYEFTRSYLIQKWTKERIKHIKKQDLVQAHPSCPTYEMNEKSEDSINTYTIYFTHHCCKKYGPAHHRTAYELGKWNNVLHYTMENISETFQDFNKDIFSIWRGAGYWLWKPWIILNTMLNVAKPCDVVCYCDAGAWWNTTAEPLWHWSTHIKYGIMTFHHSIREWKHVNLTERFYAKRDALLLLGVDIAEMYGTIQRKATFSCYQINPDSIHFVSEWLFHAQDIRIISDDENTFGVKNIPYFAENRHDQTVFSLLSKKWGLPSFTDPSQYGYNDKLKFGSISTHWDVKWIIKHTRGKQ